MSPRLARATKRAVALAPNLTQRVVPSLTSEWLETDGLGGFAMGTVGGWRTRSYHALLGPALSPPTGRHVLVNGFDAFVETAAGRFPLSTQCYAPDVLAPPGWQALASFTSEPWPTWTFVLPDGTRIAQELFAVHGAPIVVVGWRVQGATAKPRRTQRSAARIEAPPIRLIVRPLLSGRDHHALHHANVTFRFDTEVLPAKSGESHLRWHPYASLPAVASLANGTWRDDRHWYRDFRCVEEAARGFGDVESLGSPGELEFDLARGPAWWVVGQELTIARRKRGGVITQQLVSILDAKTRAVAFAEEARSEELTRRDELGSAQVRAAAQFSAVRGAGRTIVAGAPWFTDWGRDTAISVRGLCLATGRLEEARDVLQSWSTALVDGQLPNRFPDRGAPPEFGAADAALWFVVAVEELLAADARAPKLRRVIDRTVRQQLLDTCRAIVDAPLRGASASVRVDSDGLLAIGDPAASNAPGVAPTWMDARVDGRAVTPRVGKPVEIEALWWNALEFLAATQRDGTLWKALANRAHRSFLARFWDEDHGYLDDVVDLDHVAGTRDPSFRPNQLFAIGGLPRALLGGMRARRIADTVALRLWTPRGVRTLAPDDPHYRGVCVGGPRERDGAYHQGTAWPWLLFALADGWARSRGNGANARRSAHERFLAPLEAELTQRGAGAHVPEIADGDAPHEWRGCPMQAWSLAALLQGEALREGAMQRGA
ncbi:MAG: glycogen debranching protein [Planctomycetes bacterium]|nr:glycogen debranching protein [Planctomycetota bacterium]